MPPVLWGDEDTVLERLGGDFTDIRLTRKTYPQWHYSYTPAELVDFFRRYFGPVKRAFDTVEPQAQQRLGQELEQIYANNSKTRDGVLTVTGGEYLEVIATRR